VSAVVQAELLKDGQAQHYTQRMQKATLAKSTKPLALKIESKVEEKLADLKKEIEALRAVKLASPPKPIAAPAEEDEDEDRADPDHSADKDSW
jgi:hypothetical protein